MAEERRLEATLDIKVSGESHKSLDDFLAKCERAEKAAKSTREHLNRVGPSGSGSPSAPAPSNGYTSSYTAASGFSSPHANPLASGAANDFVEKMERMERISRRVKENLTAATSPVTWPMGTGFSQIRPPQQPGMMDMRALGQQSAKDAERRAMDDKFKNLGKYVQDQQWERNRAGAGEDALETSNKYDPARNRQWGQTVTGGSRRAFGIRSLKALAVVETFAKVMDSSYNMDLVEKQGGTFGEQARAGMNSTLLTRHALGLADSIRGRSQGIAYEEYKGKFGMVDAGTKEQIRQMRNEFQSDRFPLDRERSVREGDTRYASLGRYDLRTTQGERQAQEARVMQPIERERIERERLQKISVGVLSDEKGQEKRLQGELSRNGVDMAKFAIRGDLKQSGKEFFKEMNQWDQLSVEQKGLIQELDKVQARIETKKGDVVRATVALNHMSVEQLQGQVTIAEQRTGVARSQAQNIGRMNPFELMQNKASFDAITAAGTFNGFPEEVIAQFERFDPKTAAKMFEARGIERGDAMGLQKNKVGAFEFRVPDAEEAERNLRDAMEKQATAMGALAAQIAANVLKSPETLKAMEQGAKNAGKLAKDQILVDVGKNTAKQ